MMHCVKKQLKTADEKLRNIGKSQSQSTSVQAHNFTYYKHQQPSPSLSPQLKQQPSLFQPQTQQPWQQEIRKTESDQSMASRLAANRNGRRDRNGNAARDDLDRAEIKRRSRSEGPNRRLRQSMEERQGGKKQTFDGGGGRQIRRELDSDDTDDSDRPRGYGNRVPPRYDSDSDSDDPKTWTKNPLLVKKVRKSDKAKLTEKRNSGPENGRGSWGINYGNEDASSGGGGTGSGGRSKYHKLEERRKKRINLAVTSDEENATPASRISRLRQRAIQSGLGEQVSSHGMAGQHDVWNPQRRSQIQYTHHQPQQQQQQQHQSSYQQHVQHQKSQPNISSSTGIYDNFSRINKPAPTVTMKDISSPFLSMSQQTTYPPNALRRNNNVQRMEPSVSFKEQTPMQISQSHREPPARPPPPRLSFHTVPEHINPSRGIFENNNSNTALDATRVHGHFNVSPVVQNGTNSPRIQTKSNQSPGYNQSPFLAQTRSNIKQAPSQPKSNIPTRSSTQFNEVVEMRLKSNRPSALQKFFKREAGNDSEDSLDELIESNIQYLDSEIDKASKNKPSTASVSRSSSLPDPRRFSGHDQSQQHQHPIQNRSPVIQATKNSSIQLQVPLPNDHSRVQTNLEPPIIRIASSNLSVPNNSVQSTPFPSQTDLVPRKLSYDSRASARGSRPSSEYFKREDMSKSDTQLNAPVILPGSGHFGSTLHPDNAYARGCVSDVNLDATPSPGNTLLIPQADKGMFSDVDYDIEVAERVKKWENFMKTPDISSGNANEGGKKGINLTTIQEKNEGESLMLPSEVRKSVMLRKGNVQPDSTTLVPQQPMSVKPFSSDTSINRNPDSNPRVFSLETNARRFFQVIQGPKSGPTLGFQSQSVSSVFHSPMEIKTEPGFLSAKDLRQQMLSNRQPQALTITSGFAQAHLPLGPVNNKDNQIESPQAVVRRSSSSASSRDLAKRGSKYLEELDEISAAKQDTVGNLRRRFDTDSNASEDDQKSVSKASAKLRRPTGIVASDPGNAILDWSVMVPDYGAKVKENEVWSPNLESTTGVPVSIERVTARTLQTIPFSEDPFWKEIEEMTSFDPSSMAGHLSLTAATTTTQALGPTFDALRSQQQIIELSTPQSSTLPSQPRNTAVTPKERMQRSKSLYTPNITPLTINLDKSTMNTTNALDDAIDDMQSSMERNQYIQKKKDFDKASDLQAGASSGMFAQTPYKRHEADIKADGNQLFFKTPVSTGGQSQPFRKFEISSLSQMKSKQSALPTKQPLQFYQQQRQQKTLFQPQQQQQQNQVQTQQLQQNRQSQMITGGISGYQLDPNILKQKLLSTGLVVETDAEDVIEQRPSIFMPKTNFVPQNTFSSKQFSQSMNETSNPTSSIAPRSLFQPTRTSTSALDDIQQALAPFSSTSSYENSYVPEHDSLYGTTKLENVTKLGKDTTKGPNTESTSWSYQPQLHKQPQSFVSQSPYSIPAPNNRLQQVHESMDDLKDMAQNVERRINVIKSKLQTADDQSLDSVLKSLKKFAPCSQDEESGSIEEYYKTKKSKLSDALGELDRIYKDLDLNTDDISGIPTKREYKQYRPSKSSDILLPVQPKSDALRPMQTRISSVYIPGLDSKSKTGIEKETRTEFDVITKSFQAIVDEVNKTTDLLTQKNKGTTAPETQKQTYKASLRSNESSTSATNVTSAPSSELSNSGLIKSSGPPAPSLKPQESKIRSGRFRAKFPGEALQLSSNEEDERKKKERSKSVPDLESNGADLLPNFSQQSTASTATNQKHASNQTTATSIATVTTPPPVARQRPRVRPVKDNKIIQNDKANRKEGVSMSPQASPKFSRRIIYNAGMGGEEMKIKPPKMFQDEEEAEKKSALLNQDTVTGIANVQIAKVKTNFQAVSPVGSPVLQRKNAPPTSSKPSPVSLTGQAMPRLQGQETSQTASQEPVKSVITTNISLNTQGPIISPKLIMSANKTEISNNEGGLPLATETATKNTNVHGPKGRRKLGIGVAMMMDKFSRGDGSEELKTSSKRLGTLSAPDLSTNIDVDDEEEQNEESKNETTEVSKSPVHAMIGRFFLPNNVDPTNRLSSSGSSPQSPSAGHKPPLHPCTRLPPDPERQISVSSVKSDLSDNQVSKPDTVPASVKSPTVISKFTKIISGSRPSEDQDSSKGQRVHSSPPKSPVKRRVRPANRKIQTDESSPEAARARPHSFHGVSFFSHDPDLSLEIGQSLGQVHFMNSSSQTMSTAMCRSEPDLNVIDGLASRSLAEKVFMFEIKNKKDQNMT